MDRFSACVSWVWVAESPRLGRSEEQALLETEAAAHKARAPGNRAREGCGTGRLRRSRRSPAMQACGVPLVECYILNFVQKLDAGGVYGVLT